MAKKIFSNPLERARWELEHGKLYLAHKILLPLIDRKNPEAMFLYSTFRVSNIESTDEFERRSFKLLQQASDLGYPPAIYALGICYDTGDLVEMDQVTASGLFKRAAELGYSKARLSYGMILFYGSYGAEKNEKEGLNYIRQAIAGNVDDAEEVLDYLTSNAKTPDRND